MTTTSSRVHLLGLSLASAFAGAACRTPAAPPAPAAAPAQAASTSRTLVLAGLDSKMMWSPETGLVPQAPGRDEVAIIDSADGGAPRVLARLPLANSIMGPPTNLAVAPDDRLGLVANSLRWTQDESGVWKGEPASEVHVLDLAARPPRAVGVVTVGRQPSGLDISRAGRRALVANRGDRTVSLLAIDGHDVTVLDTRAVDGEPSDTAFSPDGGRALVTLFDRNRVVVLTINGDRLGPLAEVDVGIAPYSVVVSPDGRLALTGDMGPTTATDGKSDTVSVVDLSTAPPRLAAQIEVGDGAEGLAISPDGAFAVSVSIDGGNAPSGKPHYHRTARAFLLAIDGPGGKVKKVNAVPVGALGEGVAFAADGRHVYIGNFLDGDLSILRIDDGRLVDTGRRLPLGGPPASLQ